MSIYNRLRIETLKQTIINLAKRDFFNGKGRVFISDLKRLGYSYQEIQKAIEELACELNVRIFGEILIIDFTKFKGKGWE